jgi:hypothetical protein
VGVSAASRYTVHKERMSWQKSRADAQ